MGKMNDLVLFEKAKNFAISKHAGQMRKDGSPYFNHVIRVAELILKFKDSYRMDDLIVAALLHDTLEDTDTGISELRENFGEIATLLVVELTSDKFEIGSLGKAKYLAGKLSSSKKFSNWGLVIKLADRLDNVSDLNRMDLEFARRYKAQTLEILEALEKGRELTRTHKKLIKAIRKKLREVD